MATSGSEEARDSLRIAEAQDRGPAEGRLRTRTLVVIRWLALVGQGLAVFVTSVLLRIDIPVGECLVLISASAIFNLLIGLSPTVGHRARPWEVTVQLGFDIFELSGLLYLTGGIANPFCLLLIAPVTVGAAILPGRHAVALGVAATVMAMTLTVLSLPMPWAPGETLQLPSTYRAGCLLAVMVGIYFTGVYSFRAASEARRMELALHVAETVLAREQRLSALGALAAAAAHELGTPLATISVIAKELERETPEGPLRDDAWLLIEQAQRCRDILRKLAETPDAGDVIHERMSLLQFLGEMIEPHAGKAGIRTEAVVTGPPGVHAPDLWRRPEILHAMTSFVENAFDFAAHEILVTARFDAKTLALEVRDDGPGFSADILARLGEPYITSRPGAEGSRTGHVGMGLGFFIAKTLLERTGANVDFKNARKSGAIVTAKWARGVVEAPAAAFVEGTAPPP